MEDDDEVVDEQKDDDDGLRAGGTELGTRREPALVALTGASDDYRMTSGVIDSGSIPRKKRSFLSVASPTHSYVICLSRRFVDRLRFVTGARC